MGDQTEREKALMIVGYLTAGGTATSAAEIKARMVSLKEERETTGKSVIEIIASRLASGNGKEH